jgi:hypothetical protein
MPLDLVLTRGVSFSWIAEGDMMVVVEVDIRMGVSTQESSGIKLLRS